MLKKEPNQRMMTPLVELEPQEKAFIFFAWETEQLAEYFQSHQERRCMGGANLFSFDLADVTVGMVITRPTEQHPQMPLEADNI
jgi:hypothetical protein